MLYAFAKKVNVSLSTINESFIRITMFHIVNHKCLQQYFILMMILVVVHEYNMLQKQIFFFFYLPEKRPCKTTSSLS
jgi:hypothetical protein